MAAADDLAGALVTAVGQDVSKAFDKQRQIGHTLRDVRQLAARLGRQYAHWNASVQTVDRALRDFGDFEQHLVVIETDMRELGSLLKAAASRGKAPGPGKSPGSSWGASSVERSGL